MDLRALTTLPQQVDLIEAESLIGRFRDVRILTPPNVEYELNYSKSGVTLNRLARRYPVSRNGGTPVWGSRRRRSAEHR